MNDSVVEVVEDGGISQDASPDAADDTQQPTHLERTQEGSDDGKAKDYTKDFETVNTKLDMLGEGQTILYEQIGNATRGAEVEERATNETVSIDGAQWQEMRESWLWIKGAAGIALFYAMVVTLLVAAVFGSRLWSAFSKGWRR